MSIDKYRKSLLFIIPDIAIKEVCMKMSKYIGIAVLSFCLLFCSMATFATVSTEKTQIMASSSWAMSANPSVMEYRFEKETVENFINIITNSAITINTFKGQARVDRFTIRNQDFKWVYDEELVRARVGDFRWIDLDSDGIYELLVSVDFSGRPFYNSLFIIKQNNNSYDVQQISTWQIEKLDGTMSDLKNCINGVKSVCFKGIVDNLDNDKYLELIVRQNLTDYRGGRPMAIWPVVYKWDGVKYVDKSYYYKDIYGNIVLPCINKEIENVNKEIEVVRSKGVSDNKREYTERMERLEEEISTNYVVRDKILRVIGDNQQAGFERAIEWAASSKVNLKRNAIAVFKDIKGEKSHDALWELSQDKDPSVAELAKHALENF